VGLQGPQLKPVEGISQGRRSRKQATRTHGGSRKHKQEQKANSKISNPPTSARRIESGRMKKSRSNLTPKTIVEHPAFHRYGQSTTKNRDP
jgi:hypothetical protein